MSGIARIKRIQQLNTERPDWVNVNLYKLLYDPDVLTWAYESIKSKSGNMTKGISNETLDGMSNDKLTKIANSLRDESFQFSPTRRVEIPKSNGKTRPLGIAPAPEKIVQQAINLVLTAIYDPTFSDDSHGFREQRSCHTALRQIRRTCVGTSWFVEGDIKSFFDEIDHHKLMEILQKRIKDTRFLDLIWKALRAGYITPDGVFHRSEVGTPQGSIVSPILANIYLDVFDKEVERWKSEYQKGDRNSAPRSKEYVSIAARLQRSRRALKEWDAGTYHKSYFSSRAEIVEAIKREKRIMVNTDARASGWVRIKYVRYADDWLIAVIGSRQLAFEIKERAAQFLADELKLRLSLEKTHVTHARSKNAKFLSTLIKISSGTVRKGVFAGVPSLRRTGVGNVILKMPTPEVRDNLYKKGYCDSKGKPTKVSRLLHMDDWQIISYYNSVYRGIRNYYSFAANYYKLWEIQYILQYSCAKTLAAKHRTRITKLFRRRGKTLKTPHPVTGKVYAFDQQKSLKSDRERFMKNEVKTLEEVFAKRHNTRSRSVLGLDCVICGSDKKVEAHHLKHIRKTGEKLKGFSRIMAHVNRKQIPVCHKCHCKIHRGEYDGICLASFANPDWYKPVQAL